MRRTLLAILLLSAAGNSFAQGVVSSFDTFYLSKQDTFYLNYNNPLTDVGFDDGLAHFPCYYDTAFGGYWSSGFAYSNMTDTVTSGFMNEYSAKTGIGYNGSPNYAVFYQGYGSSGKISFQGAQYFRPQGFYVTNSTYAYNSMRDGDFSAKKFGGATGNDPDWFKLEVYGYMGGSVTGSVAFYLADFRDPNNANDYIVKDWTWVDLQTLNIADSLDFRLTSSDTGVFGMNTPAYFCIDDFTVIGINVGISDRDQQTVAKLYPNPVADQLNLTLTGNGQTEILLSDLRGKLLGQYQTTGGTLSIPTGSLSPGIYVVTLKQGNSKQSVTIRKD